MLGKLLKALGVIVILGAIGIAGYAFVGDLTPPQTDQSRKVTLDAD